MAAVLVTALLTALVGGAAGGVTVHYLHWNSSNPIFRIDNTDHIVDVNQGNLPWEYDQLNIICPVYHELGTRTRSRPDQEEKYIIYNVSREEYDSCRISQADPRVVAVCDKPHTQLQFTITFRSFSPSPRGLEFRPGQDYYFISTSSSRDLHRRVGGSCSEHNMKVIFKVAENSEGQDAVSRKGAGASINVARRRPHESQERPATSSRLRPVEDVRSFSSGLGHITKGRYDRDHNSGIKQEASTMTGSSSVSPLPCSALTVILLTVSALLASRHLLHLLQ